MDSVFGTEIVVLVDVGLFSTSAYAEDTVCTLGSVQRIKCRGVHWHRGVGACQNFTYGCPNLIKIKRKKK